MVVPVRSPDASTSTAALIRRRRELQMRLVGTCHNKEERWLEFSGHASYSCPTQAPPFSGGHVRFLVRTRSIRHSQAAALLCPTKETSGHRTSFFPCPYVFYPHLKLGPVPELTQLSFGVRRHLAFRRAASVKRTHRRITMICPRNSSSSTAFGRQDTIGKSRFPTRDLGSTPE